MDSTEAGSGAVEIPVPDSNAQDASAQDAVFTLPESMSG